jgi:hypothetical protein
MWSRMITARVGGPCREQSGILWMKLISIVHYYPEPPPPLHVVKQAIVHHQPPYVTELKKKTELRDFSRQASYTNLEQKS